MDNFFNLDNLDDLNWLFDIDFLENGLINWFFNFDFPVFNLDERFFDNFDNFDRDFN